MNKTRPGIVLYPERGLRFKEYSFDSMFSAVGDCQGQCARQTLVLGTILVT
jgi:hypothetical protein